MNKEVKLSDKELQKCLDELKGSDFLNAFCILDWIIKTRNENTNLKQALNEIRKYIDNVNKKEGLSQYIDTGKKLKDILQIIDKVLGDDEK